MTTYLIYTAIAGAFAIGACFGVLIMCLFAINRLADDPLPEIDDRPMPRQHEEPLPNVRGWTPMDPPGQRRQYQD